MSQTMRPITREVAAFRRRDLALCIALCAVSVAPAAASNWYLNASGGGDFPTIQAALSSPSVVNGDVITLSDGIYAGPGNRDVDFLGKNVTIRSTTGNIYQSTAIIECQGGPGTPHRGFIFHSGETSGALLLGIIVQHGYAENADGGGIWIGNASPTIDYCDVHGCVAAEGNGGGIACIGPGTPTIIRCGVYDNSSGGATARNGGGIYTTASAPTSMQYVTLNRNHAVHTQSGAGGNGGAIYCTNAQLSDVDAGSNQADGLGGAIYATGGTCTNLHLLGNSATGPGGGAALTGTTLVQCIVTGNLSATGSGGGVYASGFSNIHATTISGNRALSGGGFAGSDTFFDWTIIWGNCASNQGHEMDSGNNVTISCCCVDASGMSGVVGVTGPLVLTDPLFCSPLPCAQAPIVGGTYSLDAASPCLPANNACVVQIGALGQGCNVVAVEGGPVALRDGLRVPAVSQGEIKVEWSLASAGSARVTVHDVGGRCLATLVDGSFAAGSHEVSWSGQDDSGRPAPRGVYFVRLVTRTGVCKQRLVRIGG
jgi:hypothetical protein